MPGQSPRVAPEANDRSRIRRSSAYWAWSVSTVAAHRCALVAAGSASTAAARASATR